MKIYLRQHINHVPFNFFFFPFFVTKTPRIKLRTIKANPLVNIPTRKIMITLDSIQKRANPFAINRLV